MRDSARADESVVYLRISTCSYFLVWNAGSVTSNRHTASQIPQGQWMHLGESGIANTLERKG